MKEHHVSEECRPLIGYGKLMPPLSGGHSTLSSSFWHAYTNNIKSMLGIGLFTMPFLTAKAGLALAILVLCLFAYINYECTRMLVLCASHENQRVGTMLVGNWKHLSYQAFGELGVFVTVTTVLGAQIGVCTSYFDELTRTFVQEGQMRRSVVLPLLWMSLSILSMLITPGMRAFAWVSAAAMAALIYDAILLGFFALAHEKPYDANHLKLWDISGLPAFLGPAVFAFECAPTALNIYSSMGQIDGSAYMRVSGYAYSTGLLFILLICVLGYAGFGPDVRRVVLFSFPRTPLGLSAQWVINVVLFLSFNLQVSHGRGGMHLPVRTYRDRDACAHNVHTRDHIYAVDDLPSHPPSLPVLPVASCAHSV